MIVGLVLVGVYFLVLFIRGYMNPRAAAQEAEEIRQKTQSLG